MPSRWWYAVAAVLVVAGFAVSGFLFVKAVDDFPEPVAQGRVGTPLQATLHKEGLTVFTADRAAALACSASGPGGAVPLRPVNINETVSTGAGTWYVALRSTDPTPPGDYTVSCTSEQQSLVYAVGPRATVVGFVGTLFAALGAAGGGFVLGSLVGIVTLLRRRSAKQRIGFQHYG